MAEEKDNEQEQEKEEVPSKGRGSILKWMVILVVTVVLGGAGYFGWKYYANRMAHNQAAVNDQKQVQLIGSVWSMGAMIVNLMDNNGERYLKTVI